MYALHGNNRPTIRMGERAMARKPNLSDAAKAHKAQVTAQWQKGQSKVIPVRVKTAKYEAYKEYAARCGESLSGLICRLLDREMEDNP